MRSPSGTRKRQFTPAGDCAIGLAVRGTFPDKSAHRCHRAARWPPRQLPARAGARINPSSGQTCATHPGRTRAAGSARRAQNAPPASGPSCHSIPNQRRSSNIARANSARQRCGSRSSLRKISTPACSRARSNACPECAGMAQVQISRGRRRHASAISRERLPSAVIL